jgi:YHS domain-containing protein
MKTMKCLKQIVVAALLAGILAAPFSTRAEEKKAEKAKPYPMKTCVVSDEKLGEMGDPYTFTHGGQEFKLCCKSCLKDFKKDPAKYLKKVEAAEKKNKKS